MKNIYQLLIIVLATSLQAQWSTDPNNNLVIGYGLNPELCSDSAGGCYITYEVGYPAELYLHRVDKYGYQPWGDKRIIAGELDEQNSAKIIEDGEGGVIVSFGEHILHNSYRLRVQKVDSNGNFLWGQTGVRVSVVDTGQSVQRIVTDGNGGCVIVWMGSNSFGFAEYRINRIDSNGQRVWSDSGLYIQSDYNYSPPRLIRASDGNYYVQIRENLYRIRENGDIVLQDSTTLVVIVPNSEGGVVQSGREWSGMISKLVAQRIDSLGNHLWQEPYVEIADSLYFNTRHKIINNEGLYFFSWSGTKNGVNRIAQFQALRQDGRILFPEGSISLSNHTPLSVAGIIPSNASKTIFIWNDDPNLPDSTLAQIYDTLGNNIWDEKGIVIAHPAISYQGYTIDRNGGFIIGGIIDNFTVVAQQVSRNGKLGEIITAIDNEGAEIIPTETALYQNYPNPFNSSTIIRFHLPKESEINIDLYNVLGEKIKTIVDGFYIRGMHSFNFSSNELSSGIYLYKMKAGTQSLTKKLVIIK